MAPPGAGRVQAGDALGKLQRHREAPRRRAGARHTGPAVRTARPGSCAGSCRKRSSDAFRAASPGLSPTVPRPRTGPPCPRFAPSPSRPAFLLCAHSREHFRLHSGQAGDERGTGRRGGRGGGVAHRSSCGRAARPSPGLGRDTGVQEPDVYEAQRTAHVGGHGWPGASLTFLWPPSVPAGGRGARRPSASSLLRRLPGGSDRNAVPSERPTSWIFRCSAPPRSPAEGVLSCRPPPVLGVWSPVRSRADAARGAGLKRRPVPREGAGALWLGDRL